MKEVYIKARAKINLNLMVLGKREDNYHNIKSIFQKINLYDEIYIRKIEADDFILKTNFEEINNKDNIIYKTYLKLKERYKNIKGIEVVLNKRIPIQAGMAGGSTDSACFILGMNKLFDLKLEKNEMEEIGKSLGADVVPCLYDRAIMAQGIGETITKLDTNFKYYILIIKPTTSCNTKEMYEKLDKQNDTQQIVDNSDKIIQALKNNDIELLSDNLYNVFENVVNQKEIVHNIKSELLKNGAMGSLMTGSGSAVYGLFKDKQAAKNAYNNLKNKYQVYICTSYNSKKEQMF